MADYNVPINIANRALQHCGISGSYRITSFDEDSKAAAEVSFVYDKLRVAELRRNVWRFAIKKAALRAIGDTTLTFNANPWNIGAGYVSGEIVSFGNELWEAVFGSLGTEPGQDTSSWEIYAGPLMVSQHDTGTSYFSGELVYVEGAESVIYRSLISGNDDVPPASTWLLIDGFTEAVSILYPIGAGPSAQNGTRNIYRLPNGYLREAPADPKEGSTSYLGAPSGLAYGDFNLEGNYFTTTSLDPIILRFVADVTTVPAMDPMFCEGLAARIGLEICESLTQSDTKLRAIASMYKQFMSEARIVNGIETGSTEPPLDDYIACRV